MPVEVVAVDGALGRVVEEAVGADAGVVDEDVDLEFALGGGEVVFGSGEDLGDGFFGVEEVGLHGDAADGVRGGQRGAELLCASARGFRGEVEEERAAFCGQVAGDCLADAFRVISCEAVGGV